MKHVNRILRYLRIDMTSTLFILMTIYMMVHYFARWEGYENVVYWLMACILFMFRGIIWRGMDIDFAQELQNQINVLTAENEKLRNEGKKSTVLNEFLYGEMYDTYVYSFRKSQIIITICIIILQLIILNL